MLLGVQEEESVLVLASDADIGFVAGGGIAERAFVAQVEGMAVVSSGLSVVEDGLVAKEGDAYGERPETLPGPAAKKLS